MTACAGVAEHLMRLTMERFSEAWARGDVETLMSLMSEAPVYKTSSGLTFEGREGVRQGFSKICQPGKPAASPNWSFFGDKCLSYWSLELPSSDGEPRSVDGIDVISFAPDGRIRIKDAYRKLA
jgi:ketosteroid isomerase-like protein